MEWRIRKDARGGFSVERGLNHKGGEKIPGVMGATMPAFIVYESAHFDTDKQVKSFMKRKRAELMQGGESWAVTDNLGVVHILFIGAAFKDVKKAARLFCAYLRDELGLEIKPIWHVKALAKEPIDIMGFVIRRDRTTVRARIFVRARRQFLRAWAYLETGGYITIKAARRIISYRGYFSHTDSVGISAKLHIVEVSRAASNVISAAARAELAAAA